MLRNLHLSVQGRVQGVGFRYFTQEKARILGVKGWVRNLPDRTVEINAFGPQNTLEQFMHFIEAGPVGSRVDLVQSQWSDAQQAPGGFEIIG